MWCPLHTAGWSDSLTGCVTVEVAQHRSPSRFLCMQCLVIFQVLFVQEVLITLITPVLAPWSHSHWSKQARSWAVWFCHVRGDRTVVQRPLPGICLEGLPWGSEVVFWQGAGWSSSIFHFAELGAFRLVGIFLGVPSMANVCCQWECRVLSIYSIGYTLVWLLLNNYYF